MAYIHSVRNNFSNCSNAIRIFELMPRFHARGLKAAQRFREHLNTAYVSRSDADKTSAQYHLTLVNQTLPKLSWFRRWHLTLVRGNIVKNFVLGRNRDAGRRFNFLSGFDLGNTRITSKGIEFVRV